LHKLLFITALWNAFSLGSLEHVAIASCETRPI